MNRELAHFFERMQRFLLAPAGPEAPEGPPRLELYRQFVRHHVQDVLAKLYPLCKAAASKPVWASLVEAYFVSQPSRHFEPNANGAGFPGFLAENFAAHGLPFLSELARFEWADWEVFSAPQTELGTVQSDRLRPNPTLRVEPSEWQLCAFVAAGPSRPPEPEPGPELALLWRHPVSLRSMFLAADARAMLVLKIAEEGHRLDAVVEETGLDRSELEQMVERFTRDGLIVT